MDTLYWLMVFLVHLLIHTRHRGFSLKTIYIADECNKLKKSSPQSQYISYDFGESSEPQSTGILKASAYGGYVGDLDCQISMKLEYGGGIILSFRKVDFRPNCIDNLTLSHSYSWYKPVYCLPVNDPLEYRSYISTGTLDMQLRTGHNDALSSLDGFELVYTKYTKFVDPICTEEYFQCSVGCVWNGVRCDGHNQCGDRLDEENCTSTTDEATTEEISTEPTRTYDDRRLSKEGSGKTATTLAIVFGSALALIAIIAVIMYCWKSRRQATPGTVTHLPTAQQPYATQYQNPGFQHGTQYSQPRQTASQPEQGAMAAPPQYSPNKM